MKQKLDTLINKMQVFFDRSDSLSDLCKYSEYDVASKMLRVIKRESIKEVKPKLTLVKRIE